MLFDRVLERNQRFAAGREAQPLPALKLDVAIVACYDPRLDPLLAGALGLEPGKVFVFRTAGALVRPSGASLRSLGLAVILFGVTEIGVVGHTSCRMAAFRTPEFIDAFRRRGVPREAFGAEDLRSWAGAFAGPRQGVQASVANIRAAPFLPRDLVVWGAVLDDTTGALEVVARPGEPVPSPAAGAGEPAEPDHEAPAEPEAPPGDAPERPSASDTLAGAVGDFARTVRSQARWSHATEELRRQLDRPLSPASKWRLLESFAQQVGAESKDVLRSFDRLKRAALEARASLESGELIKLFQRMTRKR
jgi:carbonic anhydrase